MGLTVYYQNVRGLRTKLRLLSYAVSTLSENYDVIVFTETGLSSDFSNSELGLRGYVTYRLDRNPETSCHERFGGVLIAVRESLKSRQLSSFCRNIELVNVEIMLETPLIVSCVYIPPRSNIQIYEDYCDAVGRLAENSRGLIYMCGDFNCPDAFWVNDHFGVEAVGQLTECSRMLADCMAFLNLFQVNSISNANGVFLDLVFTNQGDTQCSVAEDVLINCDSHHPAITFTILGSPKLNYVQFDYFFYEFKAANFQDINNYLALVDWIALFDGNHFSECLNFFMIDCMRLLNYLCQSVGQRTLNIQSGSIRS